MKKTATLPLALIYSLLIIYASCYPFSEWRNQGLDFFDFLWAPMPKYWTGFDVVINAVGYIPLGFLAFLTIREQYANIWCLILGLLWAVVLSIAMETIQGFMPLRVSSNLDVLLNALGGFIGALMAWFASGLGLVNLWGKIKAQWFVGETRGAMVLLALWPVALIFPTEIPFGLGQITEKFYRFLLSHAGSEEVLIWPLTHEFDQLLDASWIDSLLISLGMVLPCLLYYSVVEIVWKRFFGMLLIVAFGIIIISLSSGFTFGSEHTTDWFSEDVQIALLVVFLLGLLLLALPTKGILIALVALLLCYLCVLNLLPLSTYFSQTLSSWEQGRFARFNGLAQWLGWVWPFILFFYSVGRIIGRMDTVVGDENPAIPSNSATTHGQNIISYSNGQNEENRIEPI